MVYVVISPTVKKSTWVMGDKTMYIEMYIYIYTCIYIYMHTYNGFQPRRTKQLTSPIDHRRK